MKRLCCFLICVACLFCPFVKADAALSVSAESAILIDALDGAVLFEKNADTPLPMASTTKIMTALVVLQNADISQTISVPKEAVGVEGSSAYLYEGERITVRDLLFALLLQSANDAAVALALHTEGSIDGFADEMNALASEIGLTNTTFLNPHGLPEDGHHSTARDLALLMRYALENCEFAAICKTKSHKTSPPKGGTAHYFRNHNRLLNDYAPCIGGKTGFTRAAGRCLVSAAQKNDARLICVTLSAPDDWNDHKTLFEHGFSLFQEQLLYKKGELCYRQRLVGSVENFVLVESIAPISASLRSGDKVTVQYRLFPFAYAPILGLDTLPSDAPEAPDAACAGVAVLYRNGFEFQSVKLYYTTSHPSYTPPTLLERILQFFGWKKSESKSF